MSKLTKYILKSLNYFIITIVVIFAMLMVGVKIFGIQIYTVLSGSMEPKYKVGSLIYVDEIDVNDLQVGDVITFRVSDKVVATHRIVEINDEDDNRRFRTKGDANDFIDENFVESRHVIGTPVFTIPCLGYVATFFKTRIGSVVGFTIGVILLVLSVLIDYILDDKGRKKVVDV